MIGMLALARPVLVLSASDDVGEERMVAWQIVASAISGTAALGLGSLVAQRLLRYLNAAPEMEGQGEIEISLDRYRPMARLLDSTDFDFLASRPGYRRELGNRLRSSRRRIFRMYLAELSADFRRLHAAARRMVAEAPEQHADLVALLLRQQVAFWRQMAGIELRMTLSWAGLAPADVRGLLQIVEQLQFAISAPAPAASLA